MAERCGMVRRMEFAPYLPHSVVAGRWPCQYKLHARAAQRGGGDVVGW